MNIYKTLFPVLALIAFSTLNAQQIQQDIDFNLDPVGNAEVKLSSTLPAQQWQIWLASFGNNPALLKREIERGMPAYFLDDFQLQRDDMNRSFEITFKAYGVCQINKQGIWSVDTDQKNAKVTELTDKKFMMVSSPPEFGGTIQQHYIISFPESASDIEIDKTAFGETIFTFKMDPPSSGLNMTRWAGLGLLIIGGIWGAGSLVLKSGSPSKP